MKFKIHGEEWEIIRISREKILDRYFELNSEKTTFVFGLCDYRFHKIYINEECCFDQQVATLKHELTHTWVFMSGLNFVDINEEVLCDIVTRSNDFINEVVEKFKNTYKGV